MLGLPVFGTTVTGDEELAVRVVLMIVTAHHLLHPRVGRMALLGVASTDLRGVELLGNVVTIMRGQQMARCVAAGKFYGILDKS